MRIDILSIFPEIFAPVMNTSIMGRAQSNGLLHIHSHNVRDYSKNKHKNTDDYPFGGGSGMVMMAQPIFDCVEAVCADDPETPAYCIYMSPRGRLLTTDVAVELAKKERLILLCGHYEGIDERVMTLMHDEISIGDYVLTGGELPAMVLIDCVSRFIPGVLGSDESVHEESFSFDGLLEYPQYTRPSSFRGMDVPETLLNGNHAEINKWRRRQALITTMKNRPDLLDKANLSKEDIQFLESEN